MEMPSRTRHSDPLERIVQTYGSGFGLIAALSAYVESQMSRAAEAAREQMAEGVCEHLHAGRPSGIKCLSCYSVETNAQETMLVEAEIEATRAKGV